LFTVAFSYFRIERAYLLSSFSHKLRPIPVPWLRESKLDLTGTWQTAVPQLCVRTASSSPWFEIHHTDVKKAEVHVVTPSKLSSLWCLSNPSHCQFASHLFSLVIGTFMLVPLVSWAGIKVAQEAVLANQSTRIYRRSIIISNQSTTIHPHTPQESVRDQPPSSSRKTTTATTTTAT
jgi:hypothetical protein